MDKRVQIVSFFITSRGWPPGHAGCVHRRRADQLAALLGRHVPGGPARGDAGGVLKYLMSQAAGGVPVRGRDGWCWWSTGYSTRTWGDRQAGRAQYRRAAAREPPAGMRVIVPAARPLPFPVMYLTGTRCVSPDRPATVRLQLRERHRAAEPGRTAAPARWQVGPRAGFARPATAARGGLTAQDRPAGRRASVGGRRILHGVTGRTFTSRRAPRADATAPRRPA